MSRADDECCLISFLKALFLKRKNCNRYFAYFHATNLINVKIKNFSSQIFLKISLALAFWPKFNFRNFPFWEIPEIKFGPKRIELIELIGLIELIEFKSPGYLNSIHSINF